MNLVKKYQENLDNRDNMYDQLKEEQIKKARRESLEQRRLDLQKNKKRK
jgi:hypothetical protein